VGIDPDQTSVGVNSHGSRHGSKSDGVITSKGQSQRALLEVRRHRGGDRLGHSRDIASVEELANWGVRGRLHQGVVAVTIKLDLPVELLQLIQETKLDDLEGSLVNTISGLLNKKD
jgi:hypothetical protein